MQTSTLIAPDHRILDDHPKWQQPQWFALYTRSRHEKLVSREFAKKGIKFFLPLKKITRKWSDRNKIIEEPLFKSYMFVNIPWKERWSVLNTVGVVSFVVRNPSDPVSIPEKELMTIKNFLEQDIDVDPFPYLKEGEKVYVRSGPFKGAEGFIVRKDRHCRLVVSLDLLMQSVSIVIDQAQVEPI